MVLAHMRGLGLRLQLAHQVSMDFLTSTTPVWGRACECSVRCSWERGDFGFCYVGRPKTSLGCDHVFFALPRTPLWVELA